MRRRLWLLLAVLASACGPQVEQRLPHDVTPAELALREDCLRFLGRQWPREEVVRYTGIEREAGGETLVWVNVDVADDDERLARRLAAGVSNAGNCRYGAQGRMAQAHWFRLNLHRPGRTPEPPAAPVIRTALPPGFEWR